MTALPASLALLSSKSAGPEVTTEQCFGTEAEGETFFGTSGGQTLYTLPYHSHFDPLNSSRRLGSHCLFNAGGP